jgi:hypothetical protein
MTHYIPMEHLTDVRQVLAYILLSGLFGIVIGFVGGLISFFYPSMTAETRTLIAFIMIILSSTATLWSAGILRVSYFMMDAVFRLALMKRDRNGVPEL